MKKFAIAACAATGMIAVGASANTSAPDPTVTPLSYAGPRFETTKHPGYELGSDAAREYRVERGRLLEKYLALEEANGGTLSPDDRATMESEIAILKTRYFGS
ncbi:hypothetical protein P8Q88_07020 [Qipengyuania sp. XHP0207]|uniref:hypothetical protein n=1 Tax=Qipengyuania sp. XHP0207 TaxID=3038078 RepID=UPI00241EA37E|nr:hypothetical protein [Qipengyuania sp. XHP0207]MDG5747929.1 hypothetical protein [Qipengyuania sp. XHP0207]